MTAPVTAMAPFSKKEPADAERHKLDHYGRQAVCREFREP